MSRFGTPLACAAALLAVAVAPVRADDPAPRAAAVTGLSILPGAGAAEVVIAVDGQADVSEFALTAPHRLVVDIAGATMGAAPRLYDKVVRGGITNVRIAQYKADVVRIVLDLDGPRAYSLRRDAGAVRLAIEGTDTFDAWHLGAPPAAAGTPRGTAPGPAGTAAPAPRAPAKPPAPTPTRFLPTEEAQSQEPRITVSFSNEPIQTVVAAFADFARRSIVVNQQINVRITATVVDRPWDVALASLLNANGLAAITEPSGIIIVDSYQNLQTRAQSEPLSQQVVALNYARAQDLQPTIASLLSRDCGTVAGVVGGGQSPVQPSGGQGSQGGQAAGGCPPRGSVTVEAASNSLVIFEVGSRINELVEYTRSFDFRPQQVNIRAKIIAVDRTATEQLGVQWDIGSPNAFFNGAVVQRFDATGQPLPNIAEFVNLRGDAFAAVANAGQSFENPSALSLLYNVVLGNFNLTSFIEALAQENLSDVQAEPSVNTVDRREAEIFVGNRISYLLTPPIPPGQLQAVAPQIAQLEVGIRLKVTPYISANRTVRLSVVTEQSQLLSVTNAGPNTAQRNVTNEVLVADGETAVIGGLTQTQVSRIRRGIPFLGSLPFIGRAFSSNENVERKQDLLVLITPHILDDQAVARP